MNTNKLSFVGLAAAVATAGLAMSASVSAPVSAKELRLAHFMSPKHPMHRFLMAPMAEELKKVSGGKLTIRIYPAGELGKGPRQQFQRAVNRTADMTFGLAGYTSPRFPRTLLVELPGISKGPDDATEMLWRAHDKYLAQEFKGTKVMALWANDHAIMIWRTKPIRQVSDLKGIKMRAPSRIAGKYLSALGATPVFMPAPKIYQSLSTGVIDGVFIGSSGIRSFKLHEAGKGATDGLPTTVAAFYLVMNDKAWAELSDQEKGWMNQVSGKGASMKAAKAYIAAGERDVAFYKTTKKPYVMLTGAAKAGFAKVAAEVRKAHVAELEKKGIPAGAILATMLGK